jgi:hypothetical protein
MTGKPNPWIVEMLEVGSKIRHYYHPIYVHLISSLNAELVKETIFLKDDYIRKSTAFQGHGRYIFES